VLIKKAVVRHMKGKDEKINLLTNIDRWILVIVLKGLKG